MKLAASVMRQVKVGRYLFFQCSPGCQFLGSQARPGSPIVSTCSLDGKRRRLKETYAGKSSYRSARCLEAVAEARRLALGRLLVGELARVREQPTRG